LSLFLINDTPLGEVYIRRITEHIIVFHNLVLLKVTILEEKYTLSKKTYLYVIIYVLPFTVIIMSSVVVL